MNLISWLREGRFVVPDFQREFEWGPGDIQALMRSIFLDYYIGSLLLWKGKTENFEALACEPVYGCDENDDPSLIVLDGQQRLAAMYYAFCAPDIPAPNRASRYLYFIRVDRFMEEIYDEAFIYDRTKRGLTLLENEEFQFKEHTFPLAIVGRTGWALANWVQAYERYWKEKAEATQDKGEADEARRYTENAHAFGEHLREIIEQYQITFIELDEDIEIDKVCDIFTQINSRGIRLDIFDLINALLKPKGLQLKHMWRDAKPKLDFVHTDRMNVYLLQTMSLLRQNNCSSKYLYNLLPGQERTIREPDLSPRKEVLVPDIADFKQRWENAVEAMVQTIDHLRHPQGYGSISSTYLPYISILPVFAALYAHVRQLPSNRQLDAGQKIQRWYWASVFTNRYSDSVESTSASDFIAVKKWLEPDGVEPDMIVEFRSSFRDLNLIKETKQGTSIYNAIFNLLVLKGAQDWSTGSPPRHGDLDNHHIVPKSLGKDLGLQDSIDTILNRTPLTSETNRKVIQDRLPNSYLPELIAQNGEDTVRATLEFHFISPQAFDILMRKPFTKADFEHFIKERERTLKDAIEDQLVKERLDTGPRLQALDARIESVEIELRNIVISVLKGQASQLPPHVLEKIGQRIRQISNNAPELNAKQRQSLSKKLEYCDLNDVRDILTNKSLWTVFQSRFTKKEELKRRFDQIVRLRNSIRHSRTSDEITRKDGEASIPWFEQVLGIQP